MKTTILCAALVILSCGVAVGQTEKVVWSFRGVSSDGISGPKSGLIFDKAGNLYGTTLRGGSSTTNNCGQETGCGIAYELSPNADGTWSETVLYSFCTANVQCTDGSYPSSSLIFDQSGNLYGAAGGGGLYGGGIVFELSPKAGSGGAWTETVLYNFCSDMVGQQCFDGEGPGGVIFDHSGNLFGTTGSGGSGHMPEYYGGTAFELSSSATGWTETVLYNFCSLGVGIVCPDGSLPSPLEFDTLGNLYGLATSEALEGSALVFELSPSGDGWTETVPYRLRTGSGPTGGVTLDAAGNLYGMLDSGGSGLYGSVFRLSRRTGERSVSPLGTGISPNGGVTVDGKRRSLYGTTFDGGTNNVYGGTVFQVDSSGTAKTLYSFCGQSGCTDGQNPYTNLVEDEAGNLYGVTYQGGESGSACFDGCGVVFEITP